MRRIIYIIALAALLAAGAATAQETASAYEPHKIAFGPRAGFSFDPDQFFVGGHAQAYAFTPDLMLTPNLEIGFGDNATLFAFNAELVYSFYDADLGGFTPYLGGGLGVNHVSFDFDLPEGYTGDVDDSETKIVLNILGGLSKRLDDTKEFFVELKIGPSDWSPDVKLTAGLTFF